MQRKKLITAAVAITLLFHSCTMLSPSYISFENGSAYPITIYLANHSGDYLQIMPGKKVFKLLTPGEHRIRIEIEELGFRRECSIYITYLEKRRFIFQTDS